MPFLSNIKRPFERVYTEQWMIILVFLSILVLGISWGLPDKKRMDLLTGDSPPTERELGLLTSLRQKFLQNLEHRFEQVIQQDSEEKMRTIRSHFWKDNPLGEVLTEEDRLISFRAYIIGSSAGDERKVYSSLSRMKPKELDFDPKKYIYGGAYIYPVGGILYFLRSVGLFQATNDFGYYLKHPSNIANMYIAGRVLNVMAFVGTLILLALFGNMLDGRMSGTFAMLTYSFSTIFLVHSLVSVPHVYASFWAFLSIFLLFLYNKERRAKFLIFSVVCSGWAAGSIVPAGLMAISYPIMLFDRRRLKESIMEILLAWAGIGVIFVLLNPYSILSFERYLLSFKLLTSSQGYGHANLSLGKPIANIEDVFLRSYTFPAAIIGFLFMVIALLRKDKTLRQIAIVYLCIFIPIIFFALNAKTFLFLGPLLCLFSGIALNQWVFRSGIFGKVTKTVLLCLIFLQGGFSTTLFARDYILDKKWYRPTNDWVRSANIVPGTTIGVFRRPTPNDFPPFPFLHTRMINMNKISGKSMVPDYVVIGNRTRGHLENWGKHPFRSQYRLVYDLGFRPSYWWLSGFRLINISHLSGWVYKRIDLD